MVLAQNTGVFPKEADAQKKWIKRGFGAKLLLACRTSGGAEEGVHPGVLIHLVVSTLLKLPQNRGHPIQEHQGRMFPLTTALTSPGFRPGKTSRGNTIYFKSKRGIILRELTD